MGVDCPTVKNVVREILDMIEATPEEIQNGIMLSGLLASGHGHIVSNRASVVYVVCLLLSFNCYNKMLGAGHAA